GGRRRGRRALIHVLVVVGVLLTVAAIGLFLTTERLAEQTHRTGNVFGGLDERLRPPPSPQATTFLLVGSDSPAPQPTTGTDAKAREDAPGAQRSDVIMLVRI